MKLLLALVFLVTTAHGQEWLTDQLAERMARLALTARDTDQNAEVARFELNRIIAKFGNGDARAIPFVAPLLAEPGEAASKGDALYPSTSSTAAVALYVLNMRLHLPDAPTTYPAIPEWRAWWQNHRAAYQVPAALAALEAPAPPAPVTPEVPPVIPEVTPQATPPPAPVPTPESSRKNPARMVLLGLLSLVAGYAVYLWVQRRARP